MLNLVKLLVIPTIKLTRMIGGGGEKKEPKIAQGFSSGYRTDHVVREKSCKICGDVGDGTPDLPHAKRTLYH